MTDGEQRSELTLKFSRPEKDSEVLPALDSKYLVKSFLGVGANDGGYLIESVDGQLAVALTPLGGMDSGWSRTQTKGNLVPVLDEMGLSDYVAHQLDRGTLKLHLPEQRDSKVVIFEYAGESIEELSEEEDRLEALRQIYHVLTTLHDQEYAINDFKPEHWCFREDEADSLKIKMIDVTQVKKVELRPGNANFTPPDLRRNDMANFIGLVRMMFPWFDLRNYRVPPTYSEYRATADGLLPTLEEQVKSLSRGEKRKRKMQNSVRVFLENIKLSYWR